MTQNMKELIRTLEHNKDDLIESICNQLQKLNQSHYEMIDFESHHDREEAFLNAFLDSIQSNSPKHFYEYMEKLAQQRSDQGYSLREVQEAVNIVEQSIWDHLVSEKPAHFDLIEMLKITVYFFGQAKDHLAQVYLQRAQEAQADLQGLKQKFFVYKKEKQEDNAQEDTY